MSQLKESFGIYFYGGKKIRFPKEVDSESIYKISMWFAGLQGVLSRNYAEMGLEPALIPRICTEKKKRN